MTGVRRQRASLWRASAVGVAALFVVVAVALIADGVAPGATELAPISGLVLGFVPALIWLVLFYQLDRREPEPRRLVVGVFALGALLAAAVGIPLVDGFFRVGDWLGASPLVQLAGAILVIGFIQETLKFVAYRLSVYDTAEFDEMTDGVIYGVAAGLGYAAVLCMNLVIQAGGIALGVGAVTVTVVALAHGSLGGLVGYFAAGQKFQRRPIWWTAAGIALAAVLNGLLLVLRSIVTPGDTQLLGIPLGALLGLLVTALMAAVIALVVVRLVRDTQRGAIDSSRNAETGARQ
jgi:RsiW-degrading membrane proteinase PrsW (M82 family)